MTEITDSKGKWIEKEGKVLGDRQIKGRILVEPSQEYLENMVPVPITEGVDLEKLKDALVTAGVINKKEDVE